MCVYGCGIYVLTFLFLELCVLVSDLCNTKVERDIKDARPECVCEFVSVKGKVH